MLVQCLRLLLFQSVLLQQFTVVLIYCCHFQSPTSTTSSSTYHECGRQIKKLQSSSSASSCSSSFTCLRPCFGVSRDQTRPKSSQNYNKIQSEALIRPSGASRTRKSILKQTTHRLPDGFTSNQSICNSSQHPSQITSCESDNTNYSQRYTQSENAISSDHTSVACEFDRPEFTKPLNPPSIKKNRDTEMCNHSNKTKKRKNSLHCKSPQQRSVESGDSNYLLKSRKRQNYCPKPSTKCLFSSSSCKDALAGGIAGSSICNYFSQSLSSSTQCDSLEQQFAESSTASQSCSFETCPLPFPKVASKCPFSSESCSSCENLSAGCESMSSACEFPFTPCKPSISAPCVDQSTQCSDAADQYANTNTSSFSSQTCTTDDTSYLPCKKITSFRQPRLCSRRKCCPPKSCSPVNDCSFFPCRRKPEEIRKLVKALKMEKKMEAIKSCRRKMCLQEMRRRRNKARELARRIRPKDKKFYCLW